MSTEPDGGLEADVRTMFHRRAADVVDRPVTQLPTSGAVGVGRRGHGRALLAVAAGVVLLVGLGAVAVGSGGDDPRERVVATAPDQSTSTHDQAPSTTDGRVVDETAMDDDAATTVSSVPAASTTPIAPGTDPTGPGTGSTDSPPPGGPGDDQAIVVVDGLDEPRWLQRHCDGSLTPTRFDLVLRLVRTGPDTAPLTVQLGVSGRLAAPAPPTFTFDAGASEGIATLSLPARGAVEVIVDVLPGAGYTPGAPARWRFADPDPPVRIDCLRPLVVSSGSTSQTIRVGQRPADVRFAHELPDLVVITLAGSAPPGLAPARVPGPVLRWEGAAATPGTYAFDVRACHGDLCDGTARVTITVLPA